jgi:hypothetical protein
MPVGVVCVHVRGDDTRPVQAHRAGTFSEAHDAERAECRSQSAYVDYIYLVFCSMQI